MAPIVIIGTGLAGYTVAREFRRLDPQTPLIIVSQDHGGFYSKPMISNALASNRSAQSLITKSSETMAQELNAQILPHTKVHAIDPAKQLIMLPQEQTLGYHRLVLALGANPIKARLSGLAADQVLSINHLDDYAKFYQHLTRQTRQSQVLILGAGLIGCELANDLIKFGAQPTIIDPGSTPLSRLIPLQASQFFEAKLRAAGVHFAWGVSATSVNPSRFNNRFTVSLNEGADIETDLILSAIGLAPNLSLAQAAGLSVQRGIQTNTWLETSIPSIYAIGDCVQVHGVVLPYVAPLMQQARALAATLAGQRTPVLYPAMPVIVKTPACPLVACPPPTAAQGNWQVDITQESVVARFMNIQGNLKGFALVGSATAQRQSLTQQIQAQSVSALS